MALRKQINLLLLSQDPQSHHCLFSYNSMAPIFLFLILKFISSCNTYKRKTPIIYTTYLFWLRAKGGAHPGQMYQLFQFIPLLSGISTTLKKMLLLLSNYDKSNDVYTKKKGIRIFNRLRFCTKLMHVNMWWKCIILLTKLQKKKKKVTFIWTDSIVKWGCGFWT